LKGQEDCLTLNIFVPEYAFESSLPVMAWIHGGALKRGSNRVGPQEFMDREVVIVAINYRLGPIGFLSMGTEEVPGKLISINYPSMKNLYKY
jgi:carboxylesterase type B